MQCVSIRKKCSGKLKIKAFRLALTLHIRALWLNWKAAGCNLSIIAHTRRTHSIVNVKTRERVHV